jgi:carbon storage regulator
VSAREGLAMLCLTRKPNEAIQIGDEIEIVVMQIKAGSVKLGIKVPDHVKVVRSELIERDRQSGIIRGEVPSSKSKA